MNRVLSYPGSKWNIAAKLIELIPPHHSYVEPYFGSGAVLFNKPPSDIETVNTPTAQDARNSTLPPSQIKRDSLVGDVMQEMFATPQARDYRTGQERRWQDKKRSRNLNDQISMYPTPTTGAGMCGGTGSFQQLKRLKEQNVISEDERRSMSQGNGGQLNPYWVEWLMGFPEGWTEI